MAVKDFYENMEEMFTEDTLSTFFSCADYSVNLEDFVDNVVEIDTVKSPNNSKIKTIFEYFREPTQQGGGHISLKTLKRYITKKIYSIKPKIVQQSY